MRVLLLSTADTELLASERTDREDEKEADRQIGDNEINSSPPRRYGRAERNDAPGGQRRNERKDRSENEERPVHTRRHRLFLHEILETVRGGLQPSFTDAVWAVAILDPRRDFSLGQGQHGDADHVDGEDDQQLEKSEQEKGHAADRSEIRIGCLEQRRKRVQRAHAAPTATGFFGAVGGASTTGRPLNPMLS